VSPLTPEPAAPLYQTDLAQTPLPEILVKIHRYRAPGRVECRRDDEVKRVYLEHGQIVYASTNQVSESLGDRLLAQGRITREQYDESLLLARESEQRHGVTLIEMGILSADELFAVVHEQIEAIVWSIFGWTSGTASFTPGRDKHLEFMKVHIPVPQAILRGVRHMPDARTIVTRLGSRTTLYDHAPSKVDPHTLDADELRLYEAADGKLSLGELVALPPLSSGDNARLLYALLVVGMIAPRTPRPVTMKIKTGGKHSA